MHFPYLRGRQFELIALRELVERKKWTEYYSDYRTDKTVCDVTENSGMFCEI